MSVANRIGQQAAASQGVSGQARSYGAASDMGYNRMMGPANFAQGANNRAMDAQSIAQMVKLAAFLHESGLIDLSHVFGQRGPGQAAPNMEAFNSAPGGSPTPAPRQFGGQPMGQNFRPGGGARPEHFQVLQALFGGFQPMTQPVSGLPAYYPEAGGENDPYSGGR